MSDGRTESGRDNQKISVKIKQTPGGGSDEFGRAITRIAVGQISDATGFHSSHRSAIDALADVAIRYIRDLGRAAVFYSNLSGRSECNAFDVIQGLEELNSSQGFYGASDVNHCLVSSGVVAEISQFVNIEEVVPFARSIPSFPVIRNERLPLSFAQKGEEPKGRHIPDWLPAFPDPHTYIFTPVWDEKKPDLRAEKVEQARQRRKQERSLLNLQRSLTLCNGTAWPSRDIDHYDDVGKGKQVLGKSNTFLAPPLPPGEKEVSEVVLNEKSSDDNRLSVLEAFAPAIEAAKNGSSEPGSSQSKLLPEKRPVVKFRLKLEKKLVTTPTLLPFSRLNRKADSQSLREEEKDDKKRRAEMILKEAMENPQELTQL